VYVLLMVACGDRHRDDWEELAGSSVFDFWELHKTIWWLIQMRAVHHQLK
jgi:hypothetical protein